MNYSALNRFVENVQDVPFKWGTHDCLTFTSNAHFALTGFNFAHGWIGYESPSASLRLEASLHRKGISFTQEMDKRLNRLAGNIVSYPRGTVVARESEERFLQGHILGIYVGGSVAFVDEVVGLAFSEPFPSDICWGPR